jgi:hypothetical protein
MHPVALDSNPIINNGLIQHMFIVGSPFILKVDPWIGVNQMSIAGTTH